MIITIVDASLNAIQAAAIPMPTPVHWGIAIALIVLGAVLARSSVVPAQKVKALLAGFPPAASATAPGPAAPKR